MKRQLALSWLTSTLLITAGCTAAMDTQPPATMPNESLINTYWKLVTLGDQPVVTRENVREAHLVLHQDASRLAGATGCNTLMGSYHLENKHITFSQIATTMMACPTQQMETEHVLLVALRQVAEWEVNGNKLILFGDNDKQLASFEAVHLF